MGVMEYEKIPVEVVVKYSETGSIIPLKIIYRDEIFLIDRIYNAEYRVPKGSFGTALEYICSIRGYRKKLYFDRYNSAWYVIKSRMDRINTGY